MNLAGSYLLIRSVLESFIYRKIKLIYKFIYQTKASKKKKCITSTFFRKRAWMRYGKDVEQWAEQRKAEIERLQSNENYRREFLQNLSHEFKTPVFAIQGYIDTLLNGALNNPDVNRKFLESAYRNVERMANLLSDLDEITKLESGEQPMYKENFIIQDLIRDVFETLIINANARSIRCSIKRL